MGYTNSQCCHIWAQQNKERGQTSNGNIFFNGKVIYSYGHHFPMAIFLDDNTVLINSDSYSISTSQHQTDVRRALCGDIKKLYAPTSIMRCVERHADSDDKKATVQSLKFNKQDLQKAAVSAARELCLAAARRRAAHLKESDYKAAHNAIQVLHEVYSFYGLKLNKACYDLQDMILNDQENLQAHFKDKLAKEKKAKAAAERKRKKERAKTIADNVQAFRDGTPRHLLAHGALYEAASILLRLSAPNIETSQRASFPIVHAVKAFEFIKACKDNEQEFNSNGKMIRLGDFMIDRIETNGNVKAGCHYVEYSEIERIARELKLLEGV